MSKRSAAVIGIVVAVGVAVATAVIVWPMPPSKVTISVSVPAGTKISGSYDVDGVRSQIDSETPTQFVVTGREVGCWVQADKPTTELNVKISAGNEFASATAGHGQGVNVGFHRRGNWITRSEAFWANTAQTAP